MPPTGLFYSRPALPVPPSAGRCRALRSEKSRSGRATARSCRARTDGARQLSQRLRRFEDRERVAVHFQLAPLIPQYSLRIEQKAAALDSDHLAAVHALFADHVELIAHPAIGVGQQRERQRQLLAEFLVGRQAVARDADDRETGALEARRPRRKLPAFE